MQIKTPYYLIDKKKLLKNLKVIDTIRKNTGTKFLLATKCFATWSVFDFIREWMDGTTSSSLNEIRLGYEKFGKETHAYSVAYADDEIPAIKTYADKVIFNSITQLNRYYKSFKNKNIGLRINPGISHSHFELADPSSKTPSRLGIYANEQDFKKIIPKIKGCMFHFNCENEDINHLSEMLNFIDLKYHNLLKKLEWVSLGGGIFFTKEGYPIEELCQLLNQFKNKYNIQIYLEPGDAVVYNTTELVTTVLDIQNQKGHVQREEALKRHHSTCCTETAIIDASTEAHMLDILTYKDYREIDMIPRKEGHSAWRGSGCIIAGRSCLAGDKFGYGWFPNLKVGDIIRIPNAGGYTMVKKNWFNGLPMPSIAVKELNGRIKLIKSFNYTDFVNSLS
jgi:carboxynorspermidine decarboxylase